MKKKAMGTKPIEASSMGTTEAKPINGFQLSTTEARTRLAQHASVLQAFGYFDISTLGKLTLGIQGQPTTLLQKSGALFPTTKPHPFEDKMEMLSGTVRMNAKLGKVETISGAAWVTASKNLPVPSGGKMATKSLIPINVAYWFGTNIVLPDDTKVVIDASVKSLFIIANTLTIGQRVSISWAEPPATWADVPRKPGTPEDWNTIQADGLSSERGKDGSTGLVGGQGPNAQPAPEIELWFLQSTGFPEINLRGQDGFIGVRGGDGGDGPRGDQGSGDRPALFDQGNQRGPVRRDAQHSRWRGVHRTGAGFRAGRDFLQCADGLSGNGIRQCASRIQRRENREGDGEQHGAAECDLRQRSRRALRRRVRDRLQSACAPADAGHSFRRKDQRLVPLHAGPMLRGD